MFFQYVFGLKKSLLCVSTFSALQFTLRTKLCLQVRVSQPVTPIDDAHNKKLPTVARELIFPEKVESENTVTLSSCLVHHMQMFEGGSQKSIELS